MPHRRRRIQIIKGQQIMYHINTINPLSRGHTIVTSRELTWCYACSWERRFDTELHGAGSHFCHSAHVTWSHVETWTAHVTARLSHFCCRTHFVRRELREECSSDVVTSCVQKWRKCLLKKSTNGPFYMPQSRQIIEISILMSWTHTFLRTVTASAARIAHTFSRSAS
jgi:hypothetical protein